MFLLGFNAPQGSFGGSFCPSSIVSPAADVHLFLSLSQRRRENIPRPRTDGVRGRGGSFLPPGRSSATSDAKPPALFRTVSSELTAFRHHTGRQNRQDGENRNTAPLKHTVNDNRTKANRWETLGRDFLQLCQLISTGSQHQPQTVYHPGRRLPKRPDRPLVADSVRRSSWFHTASPTQEGSSLIQEIIVLFMTRRPSLLRSVSGFVSTVVVPEADNKSSRLPRRKMSFSLYVSASIDKTLGF